MSASAGTITAVAYLLAELAAAGVSIKQILSEAKGSGKVSSERWDEIMDEIGVAEDLWKHMGG